MAKAKTTGYCFDGPAMGPEHGVYLGNREYRRGDVITAEEAAALAPEDARNIDELLARDVLRRLSADKARAAGEEV